MTFAEYRAIPALNASAIKRGRISMLHMHHALTGDDSGQTAAMRMGSLIHAAVLEPLVLTRSCCVWTGENKRGKDYTEFKAQAGDKYIVTPAEMDALQTIVNNAQRHKQANEWLALCQREVSVVWQDADLGACKARLDGVCEAGVLEVKTTGKMDVRSISNQFVNMGYDLQCGWYREGALRSGATKSKVVMILYIESCPPYDVALWNVPENALGRGLDSAREIAAEYRACEAAGVFPGIQTDSDLPLPEWYEGDVDLDNIMPIDDGETESEF